jgi:hypothetical protein
MNNEELNHFFAAARTHRRETSRQEFGFETRLLARIRASRVDSALILWAWRLCPCFASIVFASAWWAAMAEKEFRLNAGQTDRAEEVVLVESITGRSL